MKIRLQLLICIMLYLHISFSQSRISYNNQQIFLNGSNVAWVYYSGDLGPNDADTATFNRYFAECHAAGGNAMRIWLHNDGTSTPEFNSSGLVVGPGTKAISNLKNILDGAYKNGVGVQLCLWGFNMQRSSNNATIKSYCRAMLTDTAALMSYVNNSLIPMVTAVKEHPAIIAWEVFNEPEGMTNEFGWGFTDHVAMSDIQRFVNLIAGAIHRTDPNAKVTNGANRISTSADVTILAKVSSVQDILKSLTEEEKRNIEDIHRDKYDKSITIDQVVEHALKLAATFYNYYRDDRLIAAGGDPQGTLDFYEIHYYNDGVTTVSPFQHTASSWNLDKPLVAGEFYMQDAFSVPYEDLYEKLYTMGYAGALSWQWLGDTQGNDDAKNQNHVKTLNAIEGIFQNYPNDVVLSPKAGTIYSFRATKSTIESGDFTTLKWITSIGSTPSLNGSAVSAVDSILILPDTTTTYSLVTNNEKADTEFVKVEVLYPGTILSFSAFPSMAAKGEKVLLKWQSTEGSTVWLNNNPVAEDDSLLVSIDTATTYTLITSGVTNDTAIVTVNVAPAGAINRALGKSITVSSGLGGYENPQCIIDGNDATYWNSEWQETQWVLVDLGSYYDVNKIVLKWGINYARSYRIQNRKSVVRTELIVQKTDGIGGVEVFSGLSDSVRYLRISCDTSSNQQGYSLCEIEVYGTAFITGVHNNSIFVQKYGLDQNYPNPFNPTTTISYQLPANSFVTLRIYDVLGRQLKTLVNERQSAGAHTVVFDAANLSSGIYFYRLQTPHEIFQKKMVLLK